MVNWFEERLRTVNHQLQGPIVVNQTPREGVLQYCGYCRPGRDVAEKLLKALLQELANSGAADGQIDIMIRRRFTSLNIYKCDGVQYGTTDIAYERELRLLSHDNNYFILMIGIRNSAKERNHRSCNKLLIDIDIPYRLDPEGVAKGSAHAWAYFIARYLKVHLPEGYTSLDRKEDRHGGQYRIKCLKSYNQTTANLEPGYIREAITIDRPEERLARSAQRETGTQTDSHMVQTLPSLAEMIGGRANPQIRRIPNSRNLRSQSLDRIATT